MIGDLLQDMKRDRTSRMRRWRTSELHPALHRLIREIDHRREQMTGGTPNGRYPKSELAFSAGLSSRQYHRYLRGEHLPNDEEGVERIFLLAQNVGMERSEAESYLPESIEETEPPEHLLAGSEPLSKLMRELLREVRELGHRQDETNRHLVAVLAALNNR